MTQPPKKAIKITTKCFSCSKSFSNLLDVEDEANEGEVDQSMACPFCGEFNMVKVPNNTTKTETNWRKT
jgi:DNA-directed RNA polymerase subunit RPC12/RpoP